MRSVPSLRCTRKKPPSCAVEHRPVHVVQRHRDGLHPQARGRRVGLRHADVRHLGRRIGDPRHHQAADLAAAEPEEQRVGHHQPRRRVGDVGELVLGADVADGEDARVARAEPVVHANAVSGRTPRPPPRVRGPRRSARDRWPRAARRRRSPRRVPRPGRGPRARRPAPRRGPRRRRAAAARRAPPWRARRSAAASASSRGRMLGALVDDRDRRAEAGERLGQLATDRPGADDREPPGQLGQAEDGLVGEVARRLEARDRAAPRAGRRSR